MYWAKNQHNKMHTGGGREGIKYVCGACRCTPSQARNSARNNASSSSLGVDTDSMSQMFEMIRALAQSVALLATKVDSLSNASHQA